MTQILGTTHQRLQGILARLRALAGPSEGQQVLSDLEAADRRLSEAVFKLVVLGEYKRGKTTLVNALLGAPALPMAVVPLTSIVTEVQHGAMPEARIEFLSGESRSVAFDDLPAYVTEPENPQNRKGVRRAIVRHPAPLLSEGVTIVDTPGIGSVFEHNSEVTYQFLEESDAVVIVLAADQPLSAEERRLLRALNGITEQILFAVNRVDVLTPDETEASLRFIRETLATLEERPPESVHPLSARQALEARVQHQPPPDDFVRFETALHRVLIERKSEILTERAERLARKATDLLALRLESERQTLQMAQGELGYAICQFHASTPAIEHKLEESGLLLKHRVENIPKVELRQVADDTRARIMAALWPKVETTVRSAHDRAPREVVRQLSGEVGKWVVEELKAYYPATERHALRSLAAALEEHAERVQAAVGEVVTLANELLGMQAAVPRVIPPTLDRPRFYLKEWDYSGGQLRGSAWRLWLPRRWAEPCALTELRELLERRVNQNLEAVRYDWVLRLDDAVRRFQVSAREQLAAIIAVIREAMDRARTLSADGTSQARLAELDQQMQQVTQIRGELAVDFEVEPPAGRPASM
jgi:ribosome biogenesis GTPase A